jgi:hypothetical protein
MFLSPGIDRPKKINIGTNWGGETEPIGHRGALVVDYRIRRWMLVKSNTGGNSSNMHHYSP